MRYLAAITLLILALAMAQPVAAQSKFVEVFSVRKMSLTYIFRDRNNRDQITNDYLLFGLVKDTIEKGWRSKKNAEFNIKNGMIFNSTSTTSGDLGAGEFDLDVFIRTRKRAGKVLYIYEYACETTGIEKTAIIFDLINSSDFNSQMKKNAAITADMCPSGNYN